MYAAGELYGWNTKFPVLVVDDFDKEKAEREHQEKSDVNYWKEKKRKEKEEERAKKRAEREPLKKGGGLWHLTKLMA